MSYLNLPVCPLCGSDPIIKPSSKHGYRVHCSGCSVMTESSNREKAKYFWIYFVNDVDKAKELK